MKKFRELSEAIKDKYDIGEYDQEGDMAKSDLRSIIANSKRVHDMLKDDDNLPEWVQSKITKAEDYMSTVANYLESEMNEETGFEKTFRKNTGETYDQYANRRAKEEDERQEKMKKQKEDYIKQGIIKAESVELDEVLDTAGKFMSYATKAAASGLKSAAMGTGKFRKRQAGIQTAVRKTKEKIANEEVEIDEGIGGTIAGGIGQFIGNKIDPLHGEIMRAHGEVAGRAAEYTIRKHLNKLHTALKKHLSSGAVSEEVEELDEGKYGAFRTGPKRPKYPYVPQGDKDPRTGLPLGFSPIKDEPKKVKEEVESLEEKNEPTSPEKWARAKAQAKAKFDVYPSAYANGWAAKKYKEMGGGWRSVSEEVEELDENMMKKLAAAGIAASLAASPAAQARVTPGGQSVAQQAVATQKAPEQKKASVPSKSYLQTVASGKSRSIMHPDTAKELLKKHYSEETDLDEGYFKNQEIERQETERLAKRNEPPFTPDKPKKKSVVVGKKPEGYSRARQLARQAMQKYTTPVKEEKDMSKKAKVVKDIMKKSSDDKFQANPELSNSVTRNL
jgi:hypothetical protein